jgi:putative ABC transport system permease protein
VGIDRTTMVGAPELTAGRLEDLRIPDAVLLEETARTKLENVGIGDELKLNDRRAVIVGFCRAKAGFDSPALLYTTYENALSFVPLGRNKLTYILVKVKPGEVVQEVKASINGIPNIAAFTPEEMRERTLRFIIVETGIGINFGITVLLGVIIGLAVSAAIFYQFTNENLRNYAVLKAMGVKKPALIAMIMIQSLWVGLIGFGVGVGVTSVFSILSRKPGTELAVIFPWWLMLGSLVGMLLCISAGAILSLQKVLRLEPAIVFK